MPPALDGIGDYTAIQSAELARQGLAVELLVSGGNAVNQIPGVVITSGIFDAHESGTYWNLVDAIVERQPDWVLLQYNPFAYGKRGFNLVLPEALRRAMKALPNARFALMAHEMYQPADSLQNAVMFAYQRWQFARLAATSDLTLFSTGTWADVYSQRYRQRQSFHLPIGSNLPRVDADRKLLREAMGITSETIVLGVFGTFNWKRMPEHLAAGADAVRTSGRDVRVLYIGPDGAAVRAASAGVTVIDRGILSAKDVSATLSAVDIYTAAFVDGISTRRTSFFAGPQHALATVGTKGHSTDAGLLAEDGNSFLLTSTADCGAFARAISELSTDIARRRKIAAAGEAWFVNGYSVACLTKALVELLSSQH